MIKEIKLQIKSVKHTNFQIQKEVFCHYCESYQDSVHLCTVKKRHINYDKQKKIINEAATEDGAQRKGNVDGYGDCDIMKKKEQKEDVKVFKETMPNFGIEQQEVERIKSSLETSPEI